MLRVSSVELSTVCPLWPSMCCYLHNPSRTLALVQKWTAADPQKAQPQHPPRTKVKVTLVLAFLLSSWTFGTTSLNHCPLQGQRRRFHWDRIIFPMFLKKLLSRNSGKDTVFLSRQQSRGNSWTLLTQLFQHRSFQLRWARFPGLTCTIRKSSSSLRHSDGCSHFLEQVQYKYAEIVESRVRQNTLDE